MAGRDGSRVRQHAGGFSLIETLVALAIAAMVANSLYQSVSIGMTLTARGELAAARALALNWALDTVGMTVPLKPGQYAGRTPDGQNFEISIVENPPLIIDGKPQASSELLQITASLPGAATTESAPGSVLQSLTIYRLQPQVLTR